MENILEELTYPQPTWSPNINTSSAAIQLQAELADHGVPVLTQQTSKMEEPGPAGHPHALCPDRLAEEGQIGAVG